MQKLFNHMNRAHRELLKGVERAMEVDRTHTLRPGHRAEIERRLRAVRDAADELVTTLEKRR